LQFLKRNPCANAIVTTQRMSDAMEPFMTMILQKLMSETGNGSQLLLRRGDYTGISSNQKKIRTLKIEIKKASCARNSKPALSLSCCRRQSPKSITRCCYGFIQVVCRRSLNDREKSAKNR
jgi:hypothetical protein